VELTPTGAFRRSLKRLSASDVEDTLSALKRFQANLDDRSLNFEKVRNAQGYFTIRSNLSIRILLKRTAPERYDIVIVGNHDYVYERFFKK
jgi:hypothetical protein